MHIYSKHTGPVSPETNRPTPLADTSENGPVRSVAPIQGTVERSDKVEISDAGRALAAHGEGTTSTGLDPARAERIRGRILSGAYDTLDVVDAVARRLLGTGDL